ncbi:hypothetical protein [Arenibacter sp. F26102]|nr:hypothetical protein [Arenibacter sp. F26102]
MKTLIYRPKTTTESRRNALCTHLVNSKRIHWPESRRYAYE